MGDELPVLEDGAQDRSLLAAADEEPLLDRGAGPVGERDQAGVGVIVLLSPLAVEGEIPDRS